MPDGSNFDPTQAGLTQQPDGSWGAGAPASTQATTTAATTAAGTPPAPGRPASEPDLIPVYGPDGSWRGYDRPPGWKPSTTPGPAGSGVVVPSTTPAQPSEAAPALTPPPPEAKPPAEPQPPPPKGAVPAAQPKQEAPPAPSAEMPPPPPAAAAPAAPAAPPAPTTQPAQAAPAPSQAPPAAAFDPTKAGLVLGPNGQYMRPDTAASMAANPPPAPPPGQTQGPPLQAGPDGKPPPYQPPDHLHDQAWYQGLATGVPQELVHGATAGFDEVVAPLPAAIYDHLVHGIPFSQAYDQNVAAMRQVRKDYEAAHPWISTAAQVAGTLAPVLATGGLYGAAEEGAGLLARGGMALRNAAVNAGQGAVFAGGMTEGDLSQRLQAAKEGAEWGAGLGVGAAALGKVAVGTYRALRPGAQVNRKAGQALLDANKGVPTKIEAAPLPGMQRNVAQATESPGLAAVVRKSNTLHDDAALVEERANAAAVRDAATKKTGGTQLASGRMTAPEASERVVEGMQKAHDVIKQEEGRLWQKPSLGKKLDATAVKQTVDKTITNMPERFRNVIAGNTEMTAILADLAKLSPDATLADINAIRSDLLSLARTLPREQGMAKKAAGDIAKSILQGVEKNPALRNDPQAWADYVKARAFTAKMWDVFGHDPMQNMLKANRFGNDGVDARTAAGKLFGFGEKTAGERVPGGVNAVGDMLKDVQRQWAALRTAGAAGAGQLPPAVAQAARAELLQGARDFIVNSLLDHAESVERGLGGEQKLLWNRVSDFVDQNAPWITKSGLMNQDQLDLWKRIGEAAKQVARPQNLRGGKGSETYERLMKDPKIIDLFSNRFVKMGATVGGAALGGALAHFFGETGIGILLGGGAEKAGEALLNRFYAVPAARLRDKLEEAIRDPDIAHDLMQTAANFKPNPKTIVWLRSLVAENTGSQEAQHPLPARP